MVKGFSFCCSLGVQLILEMFLGMRGLANQDPFIDGQ